MPSNSANYGIEAALSVNERLVARVASGLGGHTIVAIEHNGAQPGPTIRAELGY